MLRACRDADARWPYRAAEGVERLGNWWPGTAIVQDEIAASVGHGHPANASLIMQDDTVGRPMEILLIEDSLSDARLTIEALRNGQIKHRLTLVRDGDEALQFLRRAGSFAIAPRPDLILLDLKLPKKGGREVLDAIRASQDLMRIPVVVLTVSKEGEKRLRDENLQVESYLIKPVDVDQFLIVIRQLNSFWRSDIILPPLA